MLQQSHNCIVLKNIFFGSFKSIPSIVLTKFLRTAKETRHQIFLTSLAFSLEAVLDCLVQLSISNHLVYSPRRSMPCIVHVRVMRYISGNWLSNLIDVRMSPLNFQVIAEIKVCVVKDVITNGTGCSLNDHWVRIRDALIIKIFSRSLGKAKAKKTFTRIPSKSFRCSQSSGTLTCQCGSTLSARAHTINPPTFMNDQDRISPYNINTISTRKVMRIKKNINLGIIR